MSEALPPRSLNFKTQILLVLSLFGCGIEGRPAESDAKGVDRSEIESLSRSDICQPKQDQGDSILKSKAETEALLVKFRGYVAAATGPLPQVSFTEMPCTGSRAPTWLTLAEQIGEHCEEPWKAVVEDKLIGTVVKEENINVGPVPTVYVNCELVRADLKAALGLYIHTPHPMIMIRKKDDKNSANIEFHEAGHALNAEKYQLTDAEEERIFRADEIFTHEQLKRLGLPACHPISFSLLNETAADAMQIMNSEQEYAEGEWKTAIEHRTDEYRVTFYYLSNLFFTHPGDKEQFEEHIKKIIQEKRVSHHDMQIIGESIYRISRKGMDKIAKRVIEERWF